MLGLWKIACDIAVQDYSLIYDAHNNQRTALLKFFLMLLKPSYFKRIQTRPKGRFKRFLLFNFRINLFPKPFRGARSFLGPPGLAITPAPENPKQTTSQMVLFAPSAAWELKRWPIEHWKTLTKLCTNSSISIGMLGGPSDNFINEITSGFDFVENFSGKLSWNETIDKIKSSRLLVSGDTGVLHIADYFGVPAIALIGPSAFGYPSRESSKILSRNLPCQPCSKDGRGKCKIKQTKKCLIEISPEDVFKTIQEKLT